MTDLSNYAAEEDFRRRQEKRRTQLARLPKTAWVLEAERLIAAMPDDDRCMANGPVDELRLTEARALVRGEVFALVVPAPDWAPVGMIWTIFLEDPKVPTRRFLRFSLLGGGQMTTIEHFAEWSYPGLEKSTLCRRIALSVTPHVGDRARRYHGELHYEPFEMAMTAVTLAGPQDVADRVAATLRAITWKDEFYALLDGHGRCAICARPLTDEVSKLVGVGPDCARQHGIPHSQAAASKRLQLRRTLLGEAAG
jgi:hypothetical protein